MNMNFKLVTEIIYNIALLISFCGIFIFFKYKISDSSIVKKVLIGGIIGLIGISIMLNPFTLLEGVVFDVRSILMVASGMFFGALPTIVACLFLIAMRILDGGIGVLAGVSVIISSAAIGIIWRHFRFKKAIKRKKYRWIDFYLTGLIVHITMLVLMFILPIEAALFTLKNISLPVIVIYPIATLLVSLILSYQIDNVNINKALAESEEKFKYFFENSPVGKSITKVNGKIEVNQTFARMLGYTKDELEDIKWTEITHLDDIEKSNVAIKKLYSEDMDSVAFEKRYIRKDGEFLWAKVFTALRKNAEAQPVYFLTSIIDITKQKKAEEAKAKMVMHLNQQQRLESIGTFASGVAHEINNPINGIMNYGQLILDSSDTDSENAKFAKEIVCETERVSEITKSLLLFSREEKKVRRFENVRDICEKTLSLIESIIKKSQLDFRVDIPEDLPELMCSSQQIRQVIINLVTNAKDALNEKYPGYHEDKIIKLYCTQFKKENHRWIRIVVEDHGNGIPEDIQEKIFEPFFSSKSRATGTGLGLSISYGIVKQHHGDLTFETEKGKYTKFFVDLPVDISWELEK